MNRKFKKREIRKLTDYIIENFKYDKIKLENYLLDNLQQWISILPHYSEEEIFDRISDDGLDKIFKTGKEYLKKFTLPKINFKDEYGVYIIKTTKFGEKVDMSNKKILLKKINEIKKLSNKGDYYEEFCSLFLEDFGFDAATTEHQDNGIDIIAMIKNKFQEKPINEILKDKNIYLLGQAKYLNKPVDIPVIRSLIGDSIFYSFSPNTISLSGKTNEEIKINNSPNYLCVFSHNGFTSSAKRFAKKHGVVLFTSNQLIDIICSYKEEDNLKSKKMLEKL